MTATTPRDEILAGLDLIPKPSTEATTPASAPSEGRVLDLTPASAIKVKPVHWLWDNRIPLGELTLLAGREGIAKSTIAYTLAAWITTGIMKGKYIGQPRSVIVAATEDSWEHTIVPRLMAAGANLDLVYRVDVSEDGMDGFLTLPSDIGALHQIVKQVGAALVLLDPLMSRLSAHLDSHKDAEVRVALEPLTAFAKAAGAAVLGIIHVNKSTNSDPLTVIMGSRAFAAVSRSVLFAVKSPEDDGTFLFGQVKNNLGPKDVRTYRYRVVQDLVAETDEGLVLTGKINWLGKSDRSVEDVAAALAEGGMEGLSSVDEAAGWLEDYLTSEGGSKASRILKDVGAKAGHNERNLKRAASKLKVKFTSEDFPRTTFWTLPTKLQVPASGASALESVLTVPTGPTESHTRTTLYASPVCSGDSGDSGDTLQGNGTTGGEQA
jgi:AAA domain